MGKRGPKPKPTALRKFDGTRQKTNSANEIQPSGLTKCPTAPEWLGKHGKAEWNKVTPILFGIGVLTSADLGQLAQYCSAWDDFHEANEHIKEFGITAEGHNGNTVQNPAVRVKHSAMSIIKGIGQLFGLSPTSRVGMNAPVADPDSDDLESFKAS